DRRPDQPIPGGTPVTDRDLVLALDLGTSSLRAARFDATGRQVSETVQAPYPHRITAARGGGFEAAPLAALLRTVLDASATPGVGTVAVSALWHSVLAVDGDDVPLSEVLTWESTAPTLTLP